MHFACLHVLCALSQNVSIFSQQILEINEAGLDIFKMLKPFYYKCIYGDVLRLKNSYSTFKTLTRKEMEMNSL